MVQSFTEVVEFAAVKDVIVDAGILLEPGSESTINLLLKHSLINL